MKILLVTPYIPHRDVGHGTSTIVSNWVDHFASRHELGVLCFAARPEELVFRQALESRCSFVEVVPFVGGWLRRQKARLQSVWTGDPAMVPLFYDRRMDERIRSVVDAGQFDLVQIDTTQMGQYVGALGQTSAKKVLLEIDVTMKPARRRYEQVRTPFQRFRRRAAWRRMCRYEPKLCQRFDRVYTVSDDDRLLLESNTRGLEVGVLRVGADAPLFDIAPKRENEHNIVFVGAFMHPPNIDGALWFCRKIFPRVREAIPGAKLHLIGGDPPAAIRRLASARDVFVPGRAVGPRKGGSSAGRPHVGGYLEMADVCVVPLRLGGGIKMKTIEMMAAGRAIVTTSIGNEGIRAQHEEHLLVADDAASFAAAVVRVLRDDGLRREMGAEARTLARRDHDWKQNMEGLEAELQRLVADPEGGARRAGSRRLLGEAV